MKNPNQPSDPLDIVVGPEDVTDKSDVDYGNLEARTLEKMMAKMGALKAPISAKRAKPKFTRKNTKVDPRYRRVVPSFMSMFKPGLGIGRKARYAVTRKSARYRSRALFATRRSNLWQPEKDHQHYAPDKHCIPVKRKYIPTESAEWPDKL